jgi:DNA-binding phage protein
MPISEETAQQYAVALAANLRAAMAATGYSTWSLAKEAGVTRSIITRILAKEGLPTTRAIAGLETTLGMSIWPGPLPPE